MSDNEQRGSSDEWLERTLPNLEEDAESSKADPLPTKSKKIYESTYDAFAKWKRSRKSKLTSESIVMEYFEELKEKYKPSTLWSIYSMLKATLKTKENIDIDNYHSFKAFLKETTSGFKSKKSNVLSSQNIEQFLSEAPNDEYLATKVALIFGISGACRSNELVNIRLKDITKEGNLFVVNLPDTKTKRPRTFVIAKEYAKIVQQYTDLRPQNALTDRFFLNFQKGKCTAQVIGIHKFAKMPKQIALYLKLDDPASYTGHAFRRTSATLFSGKGAKTTTLKCHDRQKSSNVAEAYVDETVKSEYEFGNVTSMPLNFVSAGPSEWNFDDPPPKLQKIATITSGEKEEEAQLDADSDKNSPIKRNYIFNNCTVVIHHK